MKTLPGAARARRACRCVLALLIILLANPFARAEWITVNLITDLGFLGAGVQAEGSWHGTLGTFYYENGYATLGGLWVDTDDTSFAAQLYCGPDVASLDASAVQNASPGSSIYVGFNPGPNQPATARLILPGWIDGHSLALAQQGPGSGPPFNTPVSISGSVQIMENGEWMTVYLGSVVYDPALPFWVIDLTARTKSTNLNGTNLVHDLSTPDYTQYPLVPITAYLEGREAGHRFTVYSWANGGPMAAASISAAGEGAAVEPAVSGGTVEGWSGANQSWQTYGSFPVPAGSATLSFSVGEGMHWYVLREADSFTTAEASGNDYMFTATGAAAYSFYDTFPDPPNRATIPVTFRVNMHTRGIGYFSVRQSDGYVTGPWWGVPDGYGTIDSWDDQGVFNPLPVLLYHAQVDPTKSWWLRDEYSGENLPIGQTDILDGWVPLHEQPPPGYALTLQLPGWRTNWNDSFTLTTLAGEPLHSNILPDWGTATTTTYPGVDGMADFSVTGPVLEFANPQSYQPGPFLLHHTDYYGGGSSQQVAQGMNDLRLWVYPAQPLALNINETRWSHTLLLRHPHGASFPIQPGQIQGDWSEANQQGWFNSWGYFDVLTSYHAELPWYVEDTTTGERLGPNPSHAQLIEWYHLVSPDPVDAYPNEANNAIIFTWTLVPALDAYRIERRRPFAAPPADAWSVLIELQGSSTLDVAYQDTSVVAGEVYAYRITALRQGTASAVSEEAWAGIFHNAPPPPPDPDSDGNGIPDGEEPAGDTDGDGIDDAHDTDDDNDGVSDVDDHWPKDKRRSEPIPPRFYGIVDLNSYLPEPLPVASSGFGGPGVPGYPLISIDDENRVSWTGIMPADNADPGPHSDFPVDKIRSVVWQNGTVLSDSSAYLGKDVVEITPEAATTYFRVFTPGGIGVLTNNGFVPGNVSAVNYKKLPNPITQQPTWQRVDSLDLRGTFDFLNGDFDPSVSAKSWQSYYQRSHASQLPDSPLHTFFVKRWEEKEMEPDEQGRLQEVTYFWQQAVFDNQHLTGHFSKKRFNSAPDYSAWAISPGGTFVWRKTPELEDGIQPPSITYLNDVTLPQQQYLAGQQIALPEKVYAVNDQSWIVGSQMQWVIDDPMTGAGHLAGYEDPEADFPDEVHPGQTRKGRGELGFLWRPGYGLETFHDLLPPNQLKALRSVVPYAISEPFGANNAVEVIATAEAIALAEADAWTPVEIFWRVSLDASEAKVEFFKINNNYKGRPLVLSPDGDYAGLVVEADGANVDEAIYSDIDFASGSSLKPGAMINVQFGTIGENEINWGWDPPLDGDPPVDSVPEPRKLDLKEKPMTWWTSIPAPTSTTHPKVIAVEFGSAEQALACQLYVPKKDAALTGQANSDDLIAIQHGPLPSRRVPLKITAKATTPPSQTQEAAVWVIPKGTSIPANADPPTSRILARLKVYVLPAVRLPVSIWRVQDAKSPATVLPSGIPTNQQILEVMKDVLLQAGIEPVLDGGSDTPINVQYDYFPRNGELLYGSSPATFSNEEKRIAEDARFAEKVRIFIVNKGTKTDDINGYAKPPLRTAFVYAGNYAGGTGPSWVDFKYTCAHELGHILGLCTRNRLRGRNDNHDWGVFPRGRAKGENWEDLWGITPIGLMQPYRVIAAPPRRWLRHEDWETANVTARVILRTQ